LTPEDLHACLALSLPIQDHPPFHEPQGYSLNSPASASRISHRLFHPTHSKTSPRFSPFESLASALTTIFSAASVIAEPRLETSSLLALHFLSLQWQTKWRKTSSLICKWSLPSAKGWKICPMLIATSSVTMVKTTRTIQKQVSQP